MNSERWEKVKGLFDAAVELEPHKRRQFLDTSCGTDERLRREVENLLASFANAGSFMEDPAVREVASLIIEPAEKLEQGRCFGHYEIIEQLGAGGMGEVYLARDKKLDRQVAIKILNENFARHELNLERFTQEAKAASALNHPNILVIHEIAACDEVHYIVSEFVAGKTLRELLKQAPLKLSEVLDISIQIADALTAAHTAHIAHRDIKPENIIVRPDGYVKILDFGLAKLVGHKPIGFEETTVKQNQTAQGVILGTLSYMSPEQVQGGKIDERTDIFSFGVALYEMLAGRTPFAGESSSDVIASILKSEPPLPGNFNREIPAELERIVAKALEKNREERYQTAKDLLVDLKRLKKQIEIQTGVERMAAANKQIDSQSKNATPILVSRPTSDVEYAVSEIKNHKRAFVVMLSVLILAAAGFAYWFLVRGSSKATPIESIAVLPFVNEGGNSDVEYLSDGMTESVINSLSQIPHLSVKARSSVFRYKGKEVEPQTIASELSVQAILNGRVVQRGDDLVLYLSLVDARNGNQLWGAQYNRKLTDLVSLQSEIGRDVSQRLRMRLSGADEQKLAKNYTQNPEAYLAYLKGRYYWHKLLAPGYEKSREYFQQAIDLDPSYSLAYSGLADYYGLAAATGLLPPDENWPKAEAAANKALALDETLAEPYNPMAAVKLYYYRDWPAAERYFRRGIELDPNYAEIHNHYALSLNLFGHDEEALTEIQRAVELEPLSQAFHVNWARILFFTRQYDRAIDQCRKTLELDQNFAAAHQALGDAYEQQGMHREAIAEWAKALTLSGDGEQASLLERTYAASGFEPAVRALAQKKLERLNEKAGRGQYVPASEYVMAYIRLGDKEKLFGWLAKAVEERNGFAFRFKVIPMFDSVRSDPRFEELTGRVGLQH